MASQTHRPQAGRLRLAVSTLLVALMLGRAAAADPLIPLAVGELLREAILVNGTDRWVEDGVQRQRSELTCGPAALSSLFTFYLDDPCSEDAIAKLAGTYTDYGTSLLGLRDACRARGYASAGYRMTLAQLRTTLEQSGVPLLAHYREPLQHFALVVAVEDDVVLVSDPASGAVTLSTDDFLRRWSGAVLVVAPRGPVDRQRVERRRASVAARLGMLREANRTLGMPRP